VSSGSRRYADPAAYLLTPARWAGQRAEFCRPATKPATADAALAAVAGELHQALASWNTPWQPVTDWCA
jgi:hypothetical protein